jgi:hypothetical protein
LGDIIIFLAVFSIPIARSTFPPMLAIASQP